MGVDISAKIILGLPYKELIEGKDEDFIEELEERLDNGDIDYASPYYDSGREDWIVGFDMSAHRTSVDALKLIEVVSGEEFYNVFGKYPEVFVSPHIT